MPYATSMTHEQKLARVQSHLKGLLRDSPYFQSLPRESQLNLYKEMMVSGLEALDNGYARALADEGIGNAISQADPTRLDDMGRIAGGVLREVNFPLFVKELITGVYGSIVQSSIEQMQAYVEMYKGLAKPLAAIAREISDADALGQVASDNPLKFMMRRNPSNGQDELFDNEQEMVVDTSDEEVQRMMYQAKLALAKERRLLLRETMLMGVQRLIVEKGIIRASLLFDIKPREQFSATSTDTHIQQSGGGGGFGFLGFGGYGRQSKTTDITVTTAGLQTAAEGETKVTGFVEVQFKSDVFSLNNFANLFADDSTRVFIAERQAQNGQQQQPGGAPGVTAAAPNGAVAPVR
jgi:hypothetical protein